MPDTRIKVMVVGGPRSGEIMSIDRGMRAVVLEDPRKMPSVMRNFSKSVPMATITMHTTTYNIVSFCMDYNSNQCCYYLVPQDKDRDGKGGMYVIEMLNKIYAAHNTKPE